jgi:transcriptional regulator NrdR family protein
MSGKERKSLEQWVADAAQADGVDPWACPGCGCKDWRVIDSRIVGTTRRRQRACRKCHRPLRTLEVPVPDGFKLAVVSNDEST